MDVVRSNLVDERIEREIVMSHVFAAPRELVFRAWTERDHLTKWFGPKGFTTVTHELVLEVGGKWRFDMHAPNGQVFDNRVTFLEIDRPNRLVFDHGRDVDDDPGRFRVVVDFHVQADGKTVVTLRQIHPSKAQRDGTIAFGAVELGHQTLDKLGDYLTTL